MDGFLVDGAGVVQARVYGQVREHPEHGFVSADIYREAVVGQPLPWPRAFRDAALAATDWVEVPSAAARLVDHPAWVAYRNALRDLPSACPNPVAIVWPSRPDGKATGAEIVPLAPPMTPEEVESARVAAEAMIADERRRKHAERGEDDTA